MQARIEEAKLGESDEEFALRLQADENAAANPSQIIPPPIAAPIPVPPSNPLITRAIAIEEFTADDINKIQHRVRMLKGHTRGGHLKELIEAVVQDDEIMLDFVCNPVFFRGDGQVLDRKIALELVANETPTPRSVQIAKEEDIIPCNAIILAMRELLNIIDDKSKNIVELKIDNSVTTPYKELTPSALKKIEEYYEGLSMKNQRLFNILCRSSAGHILEDAVFLPDGYLHEKSLVMSQLASAEAAGRACYCPNSSIEFKKEDITPCYFMRSVMLLIKENIKKSASPIAAPGSLGLFAQDDEKKNGIAGNEDKANELINEIRKLIISLGFEDRPTTESPQGDKVVLDPSIPHNELVRKAPVKDPYFIPLENEKLVNNDMHLVLIDAIEALEKLDLAILENSMKQHSRCTVTKTLLGVEGSIHSNFWVKGAYYIWGTVKHQPGWHVKNMLDKVEETIRAQLKQNRIC